MFSRRAMSASERTWPEARLFEPLPGTRQCPEQRRIHPARQIVVVWSQSEYDYPDSDPTEVENSKPFVRLFVLGRCHLDRLIGLA